MMPNPISRITRRFVSAALLLSLAIVFAADTAAQKKPYPIFTLEQYTNMMKTAGRNFGAVNVSLSKNDFEAAKEQLTRSREQIAITVTFWRDNKKEDALKMLRTTLQRMDDLDAALSGDKVDGNQARELARQVNAACQSCHAVYRDQDPATKAYRLKPGTVG